MSKYTTEVRFFCEELAGLKESVGYSDVDTVIEKSREKIFDFDYPIFDENYKPTLESKILSHYYTREIGLETVGLWKHFLKNKMREIMPYYNKLYSAELLMRDINPFYDTDYEKTGERNNERQTQEVLDGTKKATGTVTDKGNSSSTDSGTDKREGHDAPKLDRWDLYSDTPQGGIAGLKNENYLTNARHITEDYAGSKNDETINYGKKNVGTADNVRTLNTTDKTDNVKDGNVTDNGDYFEKIIGKRGDKSYAELLNNLRKNFINIDTLVIDDLKDLFMGVY